MAALNLQPKVKQLEQLKINFDDGDTFLPKVINSKKKFDTGPTNNKRLFWQQRKAFGFVPAHSSQTSGDEELNK